MKMIKKYLYVTLAILIGIGVGYAIPREPKVEIKDRVVEKERIIRRIVRVTKPDGTVEETIDEKENRDSKRNSSKRVAKDKRKWLIKAEVSPLRAEDWRVGAGYWVMDNLAVTASYGSRDQSVLVGLTIAF